MATAFNVIKSFTKRGNVLVGAGCYAAAVESKADVDKIIKIGNNLDDPWLDYYEEIIKHNQDNPCVPKIYSLNIQRSDSYYICVMERLITSSYDSAVRSAKSYIRDYVVGNLTRDEWLDKIVDYPKLVPHPGYMLKIMDDIRERSDLDDECCYDETDWDEQWNLRRVDLHTDNILQRESGQLVITDPWCHAEDLMSEIVDVAVWAENNSLTFC